MKKMIKALKIIAIVLSYVCCIVVAYLYRGVLCDIEHGGFSAPAWIALLYAIPFIGLILVCLLLIFILNKRVK